MQPNFFNMFWKLKTMCITNPHLQKKNAPFVLKKRNQIKINKDLC